VEIKSTMIKLILALALTMTSTAQAKEATVSECRDATNDMSFGYAYQSICPSGYNANTQLNMHMDIFKRRGCTNKVSLDDIRVAVGRDSETLTQLKYQSNNPYFCINDEVIKEYHGSISRFTHFSSWM